MGKRGALSWVGPRNAAGEPRAWLPGVPARDLTAGEAAALDAATHAAALASGLYAPEGEEPEVAARPPAKGKAAAG